MNFDVPLFGSEDDHRYCYARVSALKKALGDARVLDALLDQLELPGKSLAALKKLGLDEKLRLIEQQIDHFRRMETSVWYKVTAPEIFAASIFRSKLPLKVIGEFFFDVKKEADLLAPVASWLTKKGYDAYAEIPLGVKRVDVLGHKNGFLSGNHLIAIELKNEKTQFERALDQMTTFGQYAHKTYLACTPALAADYLDRHSCARGVKHWDGRVFETKLRDFGVGLLLVEGNRVCEVIKPNEEEELKEGKLKEALSALSPKFRVLT